MSFRQAVVATILASALAANVHDRAYYEAKFFGWMKEHNVKPENAERFVQMIQNFADNEDFINKHNSENHSFKVGHNQFSHMNREEWKAFVKGVNGPVPEAKGTYTHNAPTTANPASVDWISAGAVNSVKDQGQCGSCWAFSTVGALEGAYKIKYGQLTTFSEQHLVSCDNFKHGGTDMGCKGGLMDSAFKWIKKEGGICTGADWPYTSGTTKQNGECDNKCSKVAAVAPSSWVDISPNSDSAMESAIAVGPVSVAIMASQPAFQLYKSGVFTADCGTDLDHGVVAVGYGVDSASGLKFYNVRNSWGGSWGENGYIRFAKEIAQPEGQCGILMQASYPVL